MNRYLMAVYNILNFADSAPQGISSEVSCFSIRYAEVKAQSVSAEVKHTMFTFCNVCRLITSP